MPKTEIKPYPRRILKIGPFSLWGIPRYGPDDEVLQFASAVEEFKAAVSAEIRRALALVRRRPNERQEG